MTDQAGPAVAILTVSDRVAAGLRDDRGGDALAEATPVETLSDKPEGPVEGAGDPGSDSAGNEPAAEGAQHEPADRL